MSQEMPKAMAEQFYGPLRLPVTSMVGGTMYVLLREAN
jgi:hypothetical protein